MAKPDFRPPGAPAIISYLTSRSAEEAIDFYQRAFGFELKNSVPNPEGKIMHAELAYKESWIMLSPEGSFGSKMRTPENTKTPCPISLYVYCEDVDALFRQAADAGAQVLAQPEDMFWGDRVCSLADPDGYQWSFATKVGEFDPSKMPKG